MPDWPASLPYIPVTDDFGVSEPYRPALRTEVEDGPELMRPQSLTVIQKQNIRLLFTAEQAETFRLFMRNTLFRGTRRFTMPTSFDGVTYTPRTCFIEGGSYRLAPDGSLTDGEKRSWQASFVLCVIDAGE